MVEMTPLKISRIEPTKLPKPLTIEDMVSVRDRVMDNPLRSGA